MNPSSTHTTSAAAAGTGLDTAAIVLTEIVVVPQHKLGEGGSRSNTIDTISRSHRQPIVTLDIFMLEGPMLGNFLRLSLAVALLTSVGIPTAMQPHTLSYTWHANDAKQHTVDVRECLTLFSKRCSNDDTACVNVRRLRD